MYKYLKSGELKNIIRWVRINSLLVQITFLIFPLTIYMIYNKVLSYHNKNTIWFIAVLMSVVLIIQLVLKLYESAYRNLLKFDQEMKLQKENIEQKINIKQSYDYTELNHSCLSKESLNLAQDTISSISKVCNFVNEQVQGYLTNTYKVALTVYFLLILAIGKFLVIVPILFFGLNYYLAYLINKKYRYYQHRSERSINNESVYIKEILNKLKVIKTLHVEEHILRKSRKLFDISNVDKSFMAYYRGLLQKINMVINITNIAFILLVGRYMFSLGYLATEQIITCSLLTIWVARPFYHIVFNLKSNDTVTKMKESEPEYRSEDKVYSLHLESKIVLRDLEEDGIAYYNDLPRDELYSILKTEYEKISYVDSNVGLFYASVLDNLTVFDEDKEEQVKDLVSLLKVEDLIFNLPYLYNYVISGNNDQVIPDELLLVIGLIRELILKPEVLIINYDENRTSNNIKSGLLKYCKTHGIKLVVYKSEISIKNIIQKTYIGDIEDSLIE